MVITSIPAHKYSLHNVYSFICFDAQAARATKCYLKRARNALHHLWLEVWGRVADKAQCEAECFITQRDPHTECHKSRKALLAHYRVPSAGRLLAFHVHSVSCNWIG